MLNNKITQIVLLIIIMITTFSCANKKENSVNLLNALRDFEINTEQPKVVVIIPMEGCFSCIKKFTRIVKALEKPNVIFIFSGLTEKKIKLNLSRDIINQKNVLCDSKGVFYNYNILLNSPVVYSINKGVIAEHILRDPNNIRSTIEDFDKMLVFK